MQTGINNLIIDLDADIEKSSNQQSGSTHIDNSLSIPIQTPSSSSSTLSHTSKTLDKSSLQSKNLGNKLQTTNSTSNFKQQQFQRKVTGKEAGKCEIFVIIFPMNFFTDFFSITDLDKEEKPTTMSSSANSSNKTSAKLSIDHQVNYTLILSRITQ